MADELEDEGTYPFCLRCTSTSVGGDNTVAPKERQVGSRGE
jgi:hypothetical protein